MSAPPTTDPRMPRPIHALTGLRFLAAAAVFIYHVQVFLLPAEHPFPLGATAVSFFFVLSGYILTYVYHARLGGQPLLGTQVRRFLVTRWGRLWPLHFTCLLLCIWLNPFFQFSGGWSGHNSWPSLTANLLLVHSWIPVEKWFLDFNSVSWSISTEMFFYLTFPFLLACRRHFWLVLPITLGLTTGLLYVAQCMLDTPDSPRWFSPTSILIANPVTHWYQFCFGMALCMLQLRLPDRTGQLIPQRRVPRWIRDTLVELILVAALVGTYLFVSWNPEFFPGLTSSFFPLLGIWLKMAVLVPVFGAIIFCFATSQGLIARALGTRFAVWLGEISFAFYMTHQIMLNWLSPKLMDNRSFTVLSFLLAVFVSAMLFRVVEMPCKSAILAMWDGKWRQAPGKALSGLRSALTRPMGLVQLSGLVVLVTIAVRIQPGQPEPVVHQIMADNLLTDGVAVFEREANLVAVSAQLVGKKMKLQLVWQKLRSNQRSRFIHICDEEGNVLRQHGGPWRQLQAAPAMVLVADTITIPWSRWRDGVFLGTGFWSKELGASKVLQGHSDMGGYRLPILNLQSYRDSLQ